MNVSKQRIGCLIAAFGLAVMPAHADQTHQDGKESPQDLVDAFHSAFGDNHSRAVHAKGTILEGSFTASKEASTLSASPIFSGGTLPVTTRFSDFTGIPTIPDNVPEANPRGFAVKFQARSEVVDVVAHSFNGFPVATSDEFAVFLRDIGASGPGVAHPTPVEQFLDSHPIAKTFVTTQKPPPMSFATLPFFGVNSFKFINAKGVATFVRYQFVPVAGAHYLTSDELKTRGTNYLQEEIVQRVRSGPVEFDWFAQLAEPGDKIEDPSIAWPEQRQLVKLGRITIAKPTDDQNAADKSTLFLPGQKHLGIEPADPMIDLRNKAYPISFSGRQ